MAVIAHLVEAILVC